MKKFLALFALVTLITACTAAQQAAVQADLGKLQADIQAQKDKLAVQLPPAIAYAQAKGDIVYATCLQGVLDFSLTSSNTNLPDLSNPFISIEVAHQATLDGLGGLATLEANPVVQKLFVACAPYVQRTKGEVMDVISKIAIMVK